MKLAICDYGLEENRIVPVKYRKRVRDPDKPSRHAHWIEACEDHRKMLSTHQSMAIMAKIMDEVIQEDGILPKVLPEIVRGTEHD